MRAKRLNALLRERRRALFLSQEEVAFRLGISARSYGNWERGRVREWTDQKLHALADALEMTDHQQERLFRITVGRDPQPDTHPASVRNAHDTQTQVFLRDYAAMVDASTLPTFLINHRWDVEHANAAFHDLFRGVRDCPAADPGRNFLRFVLFHPDAPTVLADHKNSWLMPMLAQLSYALETHDQDRSLHAIRRDIALDPALHQAYSEEMPAWVAAVGGDVMSGEGRVRPLRHPEHHQTLMGCRLMGETPKALRGRGITRITMVLTPPECGSAEAAPGTHRKPTPAVHAA